MLEQNPGAKSAAAGLLFGLAIFLIGGGGRQDAANVGLACLLGTVFAVSLYRTARRGR